MCNQSMTTLVSSVVYSPTAVHTGPAGLAFWDYHQLPHPHHMHDFASLKTTLETSETENYTRNE